MSDFHISRCVQFADGVHQILWQVASEILHPLHDAGECQQPAHLRVCSVHVFRREVVHFDLSSRGHERYLYLCQETDGWDSHKQDYRSDDKHPARWETHQMPRDRQCDVPEGRGSATVSAHNHQRASVLSIPSTRTLRQLWRDRPLTKIVRCVLRYNRCTRSDSLRCVTHPAVASSAGVPIYTLILAQKSLFRKKRHASNP